MRTVGSLRLPLPLPLLALACVSEHGPLTNRMAQSATPYLARAAKQNGESLSDFVLDNAYQVAKELLADEGVVSLNKKQVAQIFEVLDHPPAKSVAAVRKLLTERSILDG